MGLVNASEFSRVAGVTRSAISQARDRGDVFQDESAKYDLEHPDNLAYILKMEIKGTRKEPRLVKDYILKQEKQEIIDIPLLSSSSSLSEFLPLLFSSPSHSSEFSPSLFSKNLEVKKLEDKMKNLEAKKLEDEQRNLEMKKLEDEERNLEVEKLEDEKRNLEEKILEDEKRNLEEKELEDEQRNFEKNKNIQEARKAGIERADLDAKLKKVQLKTAEVKYNQLLGNVVSRDSVRSVFNKIYKAGTYFQDFGQKYAGEWGAVLGVTDPDKILDLEKEIDKATEKFMEAFTETIAEEIL